MGVALEQGEVERALPQPRQGRALLDLLDHQLDAGQRVLQHEQQRQDERPDRCGEGADADGAGGGVAVDERELAPGGGQLGLDALGGLRQDPAGVGQDGARGRAIKHAHARLLLQQTDLLADRRRAEMKQVRSRHNASGAVHGEKDGDAVCGDVHDPDHSSEQLQDLCSFM